MIEVCPAALRINFMEPAGANKFKWPEQEDVVIVPTNEIFCPIHAAPVPTSSRFFSFPHSVASAITRRVRNFLSINENEI